MIRVNAWNLTRVDDMSFSSWDDGSWRSILKVDEEEEKEDEFVDAFGQADEGESLETEADRQRQKNKEQDAEAHAMRTKKRRGLTGLAERDEANTTETSGELDFRDYLKKPKKTDAEYLADYKANEEKRRGEGKSPHSQSYQQAEDRRGSDNFWTKNIQRGKDIKEKVADKVVRPFTGYDPSKRRSEHKNFGRVAGDKGPSKILNVPRQATQVAYDKSGKALGSAADAVTSKVGQVKEGASQKVEGMVANRQAQKEQGAGKQAFMSSGGGEMLEQLRTQETYPDAMLALTSKVNTLLTEASQEIMADKKPSNVNEIKEWMDMYQSAAPNSGETEEKKQIWEKILEAS